MGPANYMADAAFETTKRLLAQLVNEGLLRATLSHPKVGHGYRLSLQSVHPVELPTKALSVTVHTKPDAYIHAKADQVLPILRPEYLQRPVILELINGDTIQETDPGKLFLLIYTWFSPESLGIATAEKIAHELSTTALNQEKWLQLHANQQRLNLNSPAVAWEQCIVYGHPTHPFHRLCYPQPPLCGSPLEDLSNFLVPELSLVSVPRTDLRVHGPFELLLAPILERINIPTVAADRVIVPCFTKQLPSIERSFPAAAPVARIVGAADAQASMRSVALRPHLGARYILKMSLAYRITSAVRTIASSIIPEVVFMTELLEELLPPNLWIYREIAGVTGARGDLDDARQISCIIREDLEPRATANGQTLIVAAALYQVPVGTDMTYAELLFGLDTWDKKMTWFQCYLASLCDAVLPPLATYGIAVEAHAQNIVVRVSRCHAEVMGFAVRDWGGVRLHKPTLENLGISLPSVDAESPVITNNLDHVWSRFHHAFLQNHVASLLVALGLEFRGGWTIVRDELSRVLGGNNYPVGPRLLEYLLADEVQMRCFFTARLEGRPSVPVTRNVSNAVLR